MMISVSAGINTVVASQDSGTLQQLNAWFRELVGPLGLLVTFPLIGRIYRRLELFIERITAFEPGEPQVKSQLG